MHDSKSSVDPQTIDQEAISVVLSPKVWNKTFGLARPMDAATKMV